MNARTVQSPAFRQLAFFRAVMPLSGTPVAPRPLGGADAGRVEVTKFFKCLRGDRWELIPGVAVLGDASPAG